MAVVTTSTVQDVAMISVGCVSVNGKAILDILSVISTRKEKQMLRIKLDKRWRSTYSTTKE